MFVIKEIGCERGFSIAMLLLIWSSIGARETKNCEDLLDTSWTFKLVWISKLVYCILGILPKIKY